MFFEHGLSVGSRQTDAYLSRFEEENDSNVKRARNGRFILPDGANYRPPLGDTGGFFPLPFCLPQNISFS